MEPESYIETPYEELDERSAFDRFAEVFTSPTGAFSGLHQARRGGIIVWGLVIPALVAAVSALLVMLNPTLAEAARGQQTEALESARDEGKISDEQYEAQIDAFGQMGPTFMAITGAVSAVILTPIFLLLLGLIGLVIAKVFQRDSAREVGYSHALSAVLIAGMIAIAGAIVSLILKLVTGDLKMDISVAALVGSDSMLVNFLLGLLNPFTIWYLIVLGIGTAMIAGAARLKGVVAWTAVWIVGGGLITAGLEALGGMFGG